MYINLDDVYVIGTRTIPNPWLQYYGQILPRVPHNVFQGNKPFETAPDRNLPIGTLKADIEVPKNVSFLAVTNTSVSFPISTINQHWKSVLKSESSNAVTSSSKCLATASYSLKLASHACAGFSIGLAISGARKDYLADHKKKAAARIVVSTITLFSSTIPVVGPFVSVGLGLADAIWGEQFYDWIEQEF